MLLSVLTTEWLIPNLLGVIGFLGMLAIAMFGWYWKQRRIDERKRMDYEVDRSKADEQFRFMMMEELSDLKVGQGVAKVVQAEMKADIHNISGNIVKLYEKTEQNGNHIVAINEKLKK